MKLIKFLITAGFLTASYWVCSLIFLRNFAHEGIEFSADDWNENTLMIILYSTGLSAVAMTCMGILSMFTHFVFVRLIYVNEIKQAAFHMIQNRRRVSKELIEYRKAVKANEMKELNWFQRVRYWWNKKSQG